MTSEDPEQIIADIQEDASADFGNGDENQIIDRPNDEKIRKIRADNKDYELKNFVHLKHFAPLFFINGVGKETKFFGTPDFLNEFHTRFVVGEVLFDGNTRLLDKKPNLH